MSELKKELFAEPTGEQNRAGLEGWEASKTAYEQFMDEENIPIYSGIIGVDNIRNLELKAWDRLGGNGAFLYLDSLEGIKGMYVLEIPGGAELNPERHLYHEFYLVLEGHGTTETWIEGKNNKRIFEWQPGSLFY